MKLDKLDIEILEHLLERHIESEVYWGVQRHHYKRCKKLLDKLNHLKAK